MRVAPDQSINSIEIIFFSAVADLEVIFFGKLCEGDFVLLSHLGRN